MRISSNAYPYQAPVQKARTTYSSSGGSSFGEQLDIAAAKRNTDQLEVSMSGTAWQNVREMELSPYCKLMESYDAWKAQQPPRDLPDSWGPTEENLAYLKEHYTGDLSWEERVDALDTMRQLGVINLGQMNKAMGSEFTFLDATKVHATFNEKVDERRFSNDWGTYFSKDPISTFQTADDLFAWLDKLLESDA